MRSTNKTSLIAAALLLLSPSVLFAATADTQNAGERYNMALISLVGLMLILLFIIGLVANTFRQLGVVLRDKNRKEKLAAKDAVKTVLFLVAFIIPALHTTAAETVEKVVAPVSNTISGIPVQDFYAIISVILLEIIVIFSLVMFIRALLREITGQPELAAKVKPIVEKSWFWDKFNAAAPLEKEKDVLLDHDYDGIQELDNSLPPWWKYGFYLTIVIACIYLYRFQISHDGPSSHEEFVAAMKEADEEKAAYLAHAANSQKKKVSAAALVVGGEAAAMLMMFKWGRRKKENYSVMYQSAIVEMMMASEEEAAAAEREVEKAENNALMPTVTCLYVICCSIFMA